MKHREWMIAIAAMAVCTAGQAPRQEVRALPEAPVEAAPVVMKEEKKVKALKSAAQRAREAHVAGPQLRKGAAKKAMEAEKI